MDNIQYSSVRIFEKLKLGIFNTYPFSRESAFVYDFDKSEKFLKTQNVILDISPDGRFVALVSKYMTKGNKLSIRDLRNNTVVSEIGNGRIILAVYFSPQSNYVVVRTSRNGGFCLKVGGTILISKFLVEPVFATFHENSLLFADDKLKDSVIKLSFDTLSVTQCNLPKFNTSIQEMVADNDGNLYIIEAQGCMKVQANGPVGDYSIPQKYITRKFDKALRLSWQATHRVDNEVFSHHAPRIYINEALDILLYSSPLKDGTFLGHKVSTGEEIKILSASDNSHKVCIESTFFNNQVIDRYLYTFDLLTGKSSSSPFELL